MQLIKEAITTEISGNVRIQNLEDLINLMINYYQATFITDIDFWLTKKERKFFIACVLISNMRLKYTSEEGMKIFDDVFQLRRQSDIRGYLLRIEEKKFWLRSDKNEKTIKLTEFFNFDLKLQEVKLNIQLNYSDGKIK